MKINQANGWRLALAAAVIMMAGKIWADTVILKNGNQMEAKSVRYVASRQEYSVMQMDGTQIPVAAKNVDRVIVPRPPALDAAIASVNGGKYDAAVGPLGTIITEFNGLEWDNEARDVLGLALIGKKEPKRAVAIYKEILENRPPERITSNVRRHYWEALKAAEMFSVLKSDLDKVIGGPSRETAALAQLMRGDMYQAQGQKNEALYDYLRTVVLYEKVQELQPEALFKASQILDELRDPRGAELKKKLAQEYPASPFAKRATGG